MSDYTDLKTAVTDQLNRDDFTDTQFDLCVKLAEARFNRQIIVPARELAATLTVGTTGQVALPTDHWAMRAVYAAGQVSPTIEQMSLVELLRAYRGSNTTTGDISFYAISGTNIMVGPKPTANVTLTIVYYQTIPALTSGAPSNWLSLAHFDLYRCAALAEAFFLFEDEQRALTYDARTQQKIEEVIKSGRRKTSGSAPLRPQGPVTSIRGVPA